MGRAWSTYGGYERCIQCSGRGGRKLEAKRPLGRPKRGWQDDIEMILQEVGCGGMDWIDLAQDRDR